jgi:hypothetical protein
VATGLGESILAVGDHAHVWDRTRGGLEADRDWGGRGGGGKVPVLIRSDLPISPPTRLKHVPRPRRRIPSVGG